MKNTKKILSLILLLLICIGCDRSPGSNDIHIKTIILEDKDFNIELYLDRSGGVYASEYYQILKAYNDGTYSLIYSKKYKDIKIRVLYENNKLTVYEEFSKIKYTDGIDTLSDGMIRNYVKETLLSTEYDTTHIDLDSFWDW